MHLKSWIEISRENLLSNLLVFKRRAGRAKVACVVKANAYGHGLTEVVTVLKNKADMFAVDSFEEAVKIKELKLNVPVLILGYIPKFQLKDVVESDTSFTVYNIDTLKKIVSLKLKKKAKIHLKVETGLNRQGVNTADLAKIITYIKKNLNTFDMEGISTHFANIEDTLNPSFAKLQLATFKNALNTVKKAGLTPKYIHTAASAGAILFPETHFNMVRVGIGLYGLWPSRETLIAAREKRIKLNLKPVLSWKSVVAQIKHIRKGETVGYGRTWSALKDSTIAVVPIGYYDGIDRKLSNIGKVLIKGKYAPIIGRVAMNMFMVDISEINKIKVEDEVVIIGKSRKAEIPVSEIADKLDRINYEIVSEINPYLPRIIK